MTDQPIFQPDHLVDAYDRIADALAGPGWGVFADVLAPELTDALVTTARRLEGYRPARVGRAKRRRLNEFVRRDRTVWITGRDPAARAWLAWSEGLRIRLNRTLMLGVATFESHFAHYPPRAFYRRHIDAFLTSDSRVVSIVTYLNPDWSSGDGGELVLYAQDGSEIGAFPPTGGTVIAYLSELFPHEVLPTNTDRFSIAGWFRQRAALPLAEPVATRSKANG